MPDPLEQLRLPNLPVEPRPEFSASLLASIRDGSSPPGGATVRYFVDDLDAAVDFYADLLGFEVELKPSPAFAMLYRGDLRLLLSVPGGPHTMPDGTLPEPGGWNRISLQVVDLDRTVDELSAGGARFRNQVTAGMGVRQVLIVDPAGNLVELFEPTAGYHERAQSSTR
jgi:catechol 2,3-dioxygenase-like lactoylglutathione lyase family enzyme